MQEVISYQEIVVCSSEFLTALNKQRSLLERVRCPWYASTFCRLPGSFSLCHTHQTLCWMPERKGNIERIVLLGLN